MEGTSSTSETNTPSTIGRSIADRGRYRSGGGWGNLTDSTIYLKVSATTSSEPPTPTHTPTPTMYPDDQNVVITRQSDTLYHADWNDYSGGNFSHYWIV